ncbi:hypothetical protein M8998_02755 [Sphingobacterium sp. lm-10]|uniref:hypothetical protein n=1 Tax=Sphingobacterium sp. lm-10 TaxID=2944904 RepID=UPI0020220387|nr:hypothetical protein [Sphingobacterium sp. lm-10]MCL7986855.1 hypothetical protein [Sphingobacterium sp. lm-10]
MQLHKMNYSRQYFLFRLCGICTVIFVLFSCSSTIQTAKVSTLTANYCTPNVQYEPELPIIDISDQDSIAIRRVFSEHDFTLSKNIGLLSHVNRYLIAEDVVQRLVAKQYITDKYLVFSTELDAIAAELDCNGERIEQLANYLEKRNDRTVSRLTVASIILGSATAIASTAFESNAVNNVINISGGVGAAVLGFWTLKPHQKKVQMNIERNMLHNIWYERNTDRVYPPSLWRILNEKQFSNTDNNSLMQSIRARWIKYGLDEEDNIENLEMLYFNNGGTYNAEQLRNLANMHNELQASVRGIQQDLRSLINSITKLGFPNVEYNEL